MNSTQLRALTGLVNAVEELYSNCTEVFPTFVSITDTDGGRLGSVEFDENGASTVKISAS